MIGENAAQELNGAVAIAVGGVVIIEARLKLNIVANGRTDTFHIHVHRARSERQHVHEMLIGPGFHIEAVDVAAFESLRHFRCQQERASALLRDFEQHQPDHAHELGDVPAKLPLMTDRKARNVTREINLNAVEIVSRRQFAQDRHLVFA